MTDIDRLRNDFIDAEARVMSKVMSAAELERALDTRENAARALVEAQKEPHRIGWFTAYIPPRTERDVRVRREIREDGMVYDERGHKVKFGLDGYQDIQWEDDVAPVRQYTEDEIREAYSHFRFGIPSYHELINELRWNT
jgi:hypothetical protein